MVYFSTNATPPAMVAGGAQSYQNPYYQAQCGCGSGRRQVTETPVGVREGFGAHTHDQGDHTHPLAAHSHPQVAHTHPAHSHSEVAPHTHPEFQLMQAGGPPMCTLTATAPPAGCCHPAPLHCDCCNGSGYFRSSEAYGS